ncbi:MAG: recombinase family protein [Deltaproteobacteria bacterium]|nr:recombinase family protein [Deltaproteobacteria bacterium]
MSTKVQAEHLERKAYVYVRQSTYYQVENNRESQRRQYNLTEYALELGWPRERVVVVDEDQGKSGSTANNRSGFGRLVTAVGLGEVGIVMSLEASRLARNSPDWHNLIYMTRYTGTLIADEHGIYDPGNATDRMVLGLRGQMSEMELDTSIHRMMAWRMNKAQRGEFLVYPPAGYDIDDLDHLVMSSDEAVRDAIHTVFVKLDELGSAKRVCTWWTEQGLTFPVRRVELRSRPIVWLAPVYRMFLFVLHHPIYAGAYVFGRSKRVRELDATDPRTLRIRQVAVPQHEWPVLLHDHHEGYISWAQYEQNQERIRGNQQMKRVEHEEAQGPVREGWALLQGLVRCGRCGRSMSVSYGGSRSSPSAKRTLQYRCSALRRTNGAPDCQVIGGKQINDVVVSAFLSVSAGAADEAARLAVEELEQEEAAAETLWRHQIEQAEYEAERAARQYDAVEPENRLVVRTLEERWNAALARVEELKTQAHSRREQIRPLSEHERARATRLAQDLEAVWHAATTTNQDRKQLLRAAIEEVQLRTEAEYYAVKIVWTGGAVTEREVRRRKRGDLPVTATPKDTVELVRTLAAEFDDAQIACVLGKQGRRTGEGNPFTAHKVAQLRNRNDIPVHPLRRARDPKEGPFTADQAAAELGVASETIHHWLRDGILPGRQLAPGAPWKIVLTDELRKKLTGGEAPPGWVGLTEAAKQLGLPKQQVAYLVKRSKLTAVRVKVGKRQYWKIDVAAATCGTQSKLF